MPWRTFRAPARTLNRALGYPEAAETAEDSVHSRTQRLRFEGSLPSTGADGLARAGEVNNSDGLPDGCTVL